MTLIREHPVLFAVRYWGWQRSKVQLRLWNKTGQTAFFTILLCLDLFGFHRTRIIMSRVFLTGGITTHLSHFDTDGIKSESENTNQFQINFTLNIWFISTLDIISFFIHLSWTLDLIYNDWQFLQNEVWNHKMITPIS